MTIITLSFSWEVFRSLLSFYPKWRPSRSHRLWEMTRKWPPRNFYIFSDVVSFYLAFVLFCFVSFCCFHSEIFFSFLMAFFPQFLGVVFLTLLLRLRSLVDSIAVWIDSQFILFWSLLFTLATGILNVDYWWFWLIYWVVSSGLQLLFEISGRAERPFKANQRSMEKWNQTKNKKNLKLVKRNSHPVW